MVGVTITEEAEPLAQALYALDAATDPLILLSFDESHTLTVAVEDVPDRQAKSNLLHMFTASIAGFIPPPRLLLLFVDDRESVPIHVLPRKIFLKPRTRRASTPYSDIGFDQLTPKVHENTLKIEDVAKVVFMVKLGRPLCVHPRVRSSLTI